MRRSALLFALVLMTGLGYGVAAPALASGQPETCGAATPTADDVVMVLDGSDDEVSDKFQLEPGLAIFDIQVRAEGYASIHLFGPGSEETIILPGKTTPYAGQRAEHIQYAAFYRLAVEADGFWTITIRRT